MSEIKQVKPETTLRDSSQVICNYARLHCQWTDAYMISNDLNNYKKL